MSGDSPVLAYFYGDDGWSMDHAVDEIAKRVERETGVAPDRVRMTGKLATADAIAGPVSTAPMFGGGMLVIVSEPAPLARSKALREALERVLRNVAPGNALVFLEMTGGKKRSASAQELEKSVSLAGGTARGYRMPTGSELIGWLNQRASALGVTLEPSAARELAARLGGHVIEGDVDRGRLGDLAVHELGKLALYRMDGPVTVDDVRALVTAAVPDSTWAFLDAVSTRRIDRAAPHLDRLLEATPEPLILVQLHRRLRQLLIAADHIGSGGKPADLIKLLGAAPFVAQKTAEQARAWTSAELETALEGLLELDAMLKGIGRSGATDGQRRMAWITWAAECVAPRHFGTSAESTPGRSS